MTHKKPPSDGRNKTVGGQLTKQLGHAPTNKEVVREVNKQIKHHQSQPLKPGTKDIK